MKIKNIYVTILLHVVFFIFGTVLFISFFHTSLFKEISILFYRGIIFLVTACFLMLLLMLFYKKISYGRMFTYRDIILSVVLIFCLNLVFFTHLPVTADRSISVFILGYMNKYSNKTLTPNEISTLLIKKYVYGYGAVNKRLNEQVLSGDISLKGNEYQITKQGKFLMRLYSVIADVFSINKKLIYP
jgi:hypothetical protein